MSACLSINLSIYQSINLSIYQSINLSIYQSINLSIYQSINLSIYLSIYQSIYLSIYTWHYLPAWTCSVPLPRIWHNQLPESAHLRIYVDPVHLNPPQLTRFKTPTQQWPYLCHEPKGSCKDGCRWNWTMSATRKALEAANWIMDDQKQQCHHDGQKTSPATRLLAAEATIQHHHCEDNARKPQNLCIWRAQKPMGNCNCNAAAHKDFPRRCQVATKRRPQKIWMGMDGVFISSDSNMFKNYFIKMFQNQECPIQQAQKTLKIRPFSMQLEGIKV